MTTGNEGQAGHGVDALLPAEMARKAEQIGAQKIREGALKLLTLAVLGGAFIALGAMFATTVLAGAAGTLPYGVARLLTGTAFCLGLILVIASGAELFTGNALMVMAWVARRVRLSEMLRVWAIVYAGNFVGAFGTAALVYLSGQPANGAGSVAAVALRIANDKVALPFEKALLLGVLCNVLVCLAVWLGLGARTLSDRVLAVLFPVSAFVAAGFEHSVANMYFIPLGLFLKAGASAALWAQIGSPADFTALTWTAFAMNLIPVTIGNIIGGGALVAGVYWFVYRRAQPGPGD